MAEPTPQQALEQQKAQCPFCKIAKGEIPSFKVYEDDKIIGIADINPAAKGHVLLLPKEHYPILQLIPPETATRLFERVKYISKAVKGAAPADSVTLYIANGFAAGQQTTHFMIHVLPREKGDSLQQFAHKDAKLDEQKLAQLAAGVKNALPQYIGGVRQTVQDEQKRRLAEFIESDAGVKQLLLSDPDALVKKIDADAKLKALFEGIDVKALSAKLKEAR